MIVTPGPLLVVSAYPELTLPQADDGNVLVLASRARARGIAVETRAVHCGEDLPAADIYVMGGLEDEDQFELAHRLAAGDVLRSAIAAGAAVLAVNSAFQVLGERFTLPDGRWCDGLGVLDARTLRGRGFIEGPVVTRPNAGLGLPALSGYESHFGHTELGPGLSPLAEVEIGGGNTGAEPALDGAVRERVVGTYLHGPVLARNPELADYLLVAVTGTELEPLPPSFAEASRESRIGEAREWAAGGHRRVKM
jgi:hypothetical protein